MSASENVRVLVSYTQEGTVHLERCRALADRLRCDGIDATIDQYVQAPPEGWPRWMQQQIAAANYVLLVCTPTYCRRFNGTEAPHQGQGVTWEGHIITQDFYNNGTLNKRIIPVLFDGEPVTSVPLVFQPFTRYRLMDEYNALYRHVSAQPAIVAPSMGARKVMSPRSDAVPLPDAPTPLTEWSDWWINTDIQGRSLTIIDDADERRTLKAWGPPVLLSDKCAASQRNRALLQWSTAGQARRLNKHPWDHATSLSYRHEHGDQPRILAFHRVGAPELLTYGKSCELTVEDIEAEDNDFLRRFIIEGKLVRIQAQRGPTLANTRYSSDLMVLGAEGTVNLGITGTTPGELDPTTGAWRELSAEEEIKHLVERNQRASEFGLEIPFLERDAQDLFDQLKTAERLTAFTYTDISAIFGRALTPGEARLYARHCVVTGIFAGHSEHGELFIGALSNDDSISRLRAPVQTPQVALTAKAREMADVYSWSAKVHNLSPGLLRIEGFVVLWRFRDRGTASRHAVPARHIIGSGESLDLELILSLNKIQEFARQICAPVSATISHSVIFASLQLDLRLAAPSSALFHVFLELPAGPDHLRERRRFLCSSDHDVVHQGVRVSSQNQHNAAQRRRGGKR